MGRKRRSAYIGVVIHVAGMQVCSVPFQELLEAF